MNPTRTVLLIVLAAASLLAVACSGSTTEISQSGDNAGISVTGRGEVIAEPDTGYFNIGVEVTAKTVAEAREQAASVLKDVVDSLKHNGVDDDDLQTTNFSIYPQYNYRNNEQPEIIGFMVTNLLNVTVRELDEFSDVLDEAIEAGGDDVRVNSIRFDRDDKDKLIEQAREQAMEDARAKAEQLADFGDVDLGEPISIVESSSTVPSPLYYEERAYADDAGFSSTPIQPGTTSVFVTVSVRWSIDK